MFNYRLLRPKYVTFGLNSIQSNKIIKLITTMIIENQAELM